MKLWRVGRRRSRDLCILLLCFSIAVITACKTTESKDADTEATTTVTVVNDDPLVRFSDNNNVLSVNNRNYRRMTRQRMEEEAELNSRAGSTWVMEGQGAYLFAQNKTRREGDLLKVHLEGPPMKQVETKVTVIKLLLKQLEEEEQRQRDEDQKIKLMQAQQQYGADSKEVQKLAAEQAEQKEHETASRGPASVDSVEPTEKKDEVPEWVPTRLVERMPDGNYRIRGQQPFMIGKREYKVLVTGIIRAEDFNDEGVSANKLLDPQFDVVSLRKIKAAGAPMPASTAAAAPIPTPAPPPAPTPAPTPQATAAAGPAGPATQETK